MNYLKRPFKKDEEDTKNKQLIRQVVDSSQESEDQGNMPSDDEMDATDMSEDLPADSSDADLSPEMEQPDMSDQSDDEMSDESMDDESPDQFADDESMDQPMGDEDQPENMDEGDDQEMSEDMGDDETAQSSGEVIYVAGDGDEIGSHVGQAVLHDDEQALHEISNAINEGQQTVIEWTESNGGTIISAGGDEFVAILPAELYEQLEDLREAYAQIVGATLTLGVGSSMSEAGKSLIYGKLNGKDQIAHYDPSMEDFLDQAHDQKPSDQEKYNEHYLDSVYDHEASPDEDPALDELDPADPMSAGMPQPAEKIEEEQVAELPEAGEMQKDEQSLRDKMLNVVESFRSEKETIEATQQQNPELYQAFMTTLASMMDLARKMGPDAQAPAQEEAPPEQADMSAPLQQPEDPAAGEPQG